MLVDTHCHLMREYYDNLDEIVKNMNGLMIVSGVDDKSNLEVLDLVSRYDNVYGTLGLHPENIDSLTKNSFDIIEQNLNNPKIVGIGEIGLDYYWVKDNKEEQKNLFIKQLELAKKYSKPIVVHSREAIKDTYDILKNYKLRGTIHCFNSSLEMAREFIKLGYKIGIGGVVTFKNAKKLCEIVEKIDIKDILIETDSPYLTPEPFRGNKNEPKNVYFVALKIASLKGLSLGNVIKATYENAISEFDLLDKK